MGKNLNYKKLLFNSCLRPFFHWEEEQEREEDLGGSCFVLCSVLATSQPPVTSRCHLLYFIETSSERSLCHLSEAPQLISLILICFFMRLCHLLKRKTVSTQFLENHPKTLPGTPNHTPHTAQTARLPSLSSQRPPSLGNHSPPNMRCSAVHASSQLGCSTPRPRWGHHGHLCGCMPSQMQPREVSRRATGVLGHRKQLCFLI